MVRVQRVVAVLLAAGLALGGTAAFVYAQQKKLEKPRISNPRFAQARAFAPTCGDASCAAPFSFVLGRPGRIDAEIVDDDGDRVRGLLRGEQRRGAVRLRWDGRTDRGTVAPDGTYHLRVRLLPERREITLPNPIEIDTVPPRVEASPPTGEVISPAFGGDAFRFPVETNEPVQLRAEVFRIGPTGTRSRPLYVDPARRRPRREVAWKGLIGGRPARPGTYVVGWSARDAAGNVVQVPEAGAVAPAGVVRVRTVELTPDLRVLTAARSATLERFRPGAAFPGARVAAVTGPPAALRLPRPAAPGLFAVRARAGGFSTWMPEAVPGRAAVLVVAPSYTWQARNGYDADADGRPDLPPAPLRLDRPLGLGGERAARRLATAVAPVTAALPVAGAITDRALEERGVPAGARLLVLAGLQVWTPALRERVAAFRARGGRLLLLGGPPGTRAERRDDVLVVRDASRWEPRGVGVFRRPAPALRALGTTPP